MIISVASGKGGTGKTTIAVNLALSLGHVQFLDCDVEEPNAFFFLKPKIRKKVTAVIPIPEIDETKCRYCGRCQEVCVYNAIAVLPSRNEKKGRVLILPHLCHGCGACSYLCPQKAIREVDKEIGTIEIGDCGDIQFVQGQLNIGEAISPPIIRQVKKYINPTRTVIIDAPPGTSCPVITSIKESDFCILVTEPTPFGFNDLLLAVESLRELKIPFGVVINRSDLGYEKTENFCEKEDIPIFMKIPFKREIAQAYSKGEPIIQLFPEYRRRFLELFEAIRQLLEKNRGGCVVSF